MSDNPRVGQVRTDGAVVYLVVRTLVSTIDDVYDCLVLASDPRFYDFAGGQVYRWHLGSVRGDDVLGDLC